MTRGINLRTSDKQRNIIFAVLVIMLGILVRVIGFGRVPMGFNQDEAYAAYEAYSLLNFGVDSFGYHNPCYFVTWGSGMNVLESYLAIPFFYIFGVSPTVFRLPQLIVSCLSLVVFYLLLKEMYGDKKALLGTLILSVCPWHIMISKWGLESNMAPAFLLFGFYFFVKGVKNNKFFILSAFMYGISLYAHAMTWMFVPIVLLLSGIYVLVMKKCTSVKCILISIVTLFVMALPLILFMLVNKDIIPEIRTPFFSVPKLVAMRDGMFSFKIKSVFKTAMVFLGKIIIFQDDGLIWNIIPKFKLFYNMSAPFIILGFVGTIVKCVKSIKKRVFSYDLLIVIYIMVAVLVNCVLEAYYVNINRANMLYIFLVILIAEGIHLLICGICRLLRRYISKEKIIGNIRIFARGGVAILCVVGVMCFGRYYFREYKEMSANTFGYDIIGAVEYTKESGFDKVYVDINICFAQILFADKTSHEEWINTRIYNNYPSAFMNVKTFANYEFVSYVPNIGSSNAYIYKGSPDGWNKDYYDVLCFGCYVVVTERAQ